MTNVAKIACLAMLACIIVTSGCGAPASSAPFVQVNVPPDKSVIYIYRKQRMAGAANTVELFANGENITRMTNGGYYVYVVEPGPIEFKGLQDINPILIGYHLVGKYLEGQYTMYRFIAQPGQEYFLEFNIVGLKMKPVSSQEGLDNLKNLRMFENKRKKSPGEGEPNATGASSQ